MTRLHARLLLCLALPLLAWPARGISEPSSRREKNAELGTEVELPCALELPKCNGLHSIKWYRGPKRIFVFSEGAGVTRGNSSVAARADMIYVANTNVTFLKIPNVQLEDEGLYKCEPTYLAVNRECNNVQHISLNVTVQPSFVRVTDEETNAILSSGTTLGPINEGTEISLNCESGEGKPVPVVEWYSGNRSLEATSRLEINDNGIGTGSSRLEMQITRDELGATFTCRVGSPALREPLTIDIHLDVNVRPSKMNLTGFAGHAVQETNILLQCVVNGARPAANVTWYNGTTPLGEDRTRFKMFETEITNESDGTYKTDSRLAFTAKEFDNGKTFSCHAENTVTREEGIKPMKVAQAIEVWYVPIVRMKPDNITVNETDNFLMFCDYEANPATLNSVKWLLDGEELTLNKEHYEGGITEQTALMVKNATQADMGTYTCILSNDIGESKTDDYVDVSVLYKPVVEVTMEPEAPVNEADHLNVSLVCNLLDGNPPTLTAVRWYLDGDLLKELPDCPRNATPPTPEETSTYCDIDPSKLLLEAVGRSFHGNYSCVGRNDAGWGFVSANTSVVVHYKPGPASISYEPKQVIKKGPLNITCSVEDPGRPKATGYKWFRGLHRLPDENNALLRIESVNLEEEANFTCMAYNEAGDGDPVTTFIDVSAAPAFIKKLSTYQGYVYNAPNVSIECWVECAPICNITWLKDNVPINFARTDKYYVSNVFHPPSPSSNDFESVQSTLIWNLTARPGGQLDRFSDSVLFTCESTSNGIGPGVKSSTHFHVEFPPENMTISEKVINVVVDHIPKNVLCGAKAHPEPTFRWYREDSTETILEGRILTFKTSIPRRSAGTYFCEASNRHGNRTISTYMNVQYKPECRIDRDRVDGQDYVVCSAIANPKESGFSWSLKNDNDTLEQVSEDRNEKSYLPLDGSVSNFRTYICVANNSIGFSSPCERTVPGNVPWWSRLLGDLLIVVIVAAVIILVVIIVVCIVIFLLCRRKRNQVKYNNRVVELEEREHPEGGPPSPSASSRSAQSRPSRVGPTPARWPLKPGVLVHVNRSHSLRSGLADCESRVCRDRSSPPPPPLVRRALDLDEPRAMLAGASRIRAMFGAQLRDHDAFPGVSRDKTAVTYKRIAPHQGTLHGIPGAVSANGGSANANPSRKRKKPGADPNPAANNNHVDSISEGLPEPETKTFYENLPFHGIQTPPNKLVSPKFARVSALHGTLHSATTSPCSSRPASRAASLCGGSSGYGSTKSHLGPHYGPHNMPRTNSPEPKCNTLKPRRRKHRHARFYSLRLCHGHRPARGNYRLYAIPIFKSCPHKSASTTTIATTDQPEDAASTPDSGAPTPEEPSTDETKSRTPPVPAPRTKRTDPSLHTYQNVPPPVFPQKSTTLARTKTNSQHKYQEHYRQRQQQEHQGGYAIPSNSSGQLTSLTRGTHHPSSVVGPLQTSLAHTNNRHSLPHRDASLPGQHGAGEPEPGHDRMPTRQGSGHEESGAGTTGTVGSRRGERRKPRKHEPADRKQKQRRPDARRHAPDQGYATSRETSFHRNQELGIPESGKIAYPHYYEDAITLDHPQKPRNPHQLDRGVHYADLNLPKGRTKGKRYTQSHRDVRTPGGVPNSTQYAELRFRDVGKEIDV